MWGYFMLVSELLQHKVVDTFVAIQQHCGRFIAESAHIPLYKALPSTYGDVHKVKVRLKRSTNPVGDIFNEAFSKNTHNLQGKAVFGYVTPPVVAEGLDLFYIFPTDTYQYLYSKEVTNSSQNYKQVVDTLIEAFDVDKATSIVTDLLTYTYNATNLIEGLQSKSEIILYNIPCYYAVKVSKYSYFDIVG